jgi:hypothetical protein
MAHHIRSCLSSSKIQSFTSHRCALKQHRLWNFGTALTLRYSIDLSTVDRYLRPIMQHKPKLVYGHSSCPLSSTLSRLRLPCLQRALLVLYAILKRNSSITRESEKSKVSLTCFLTSDEQSVWFRCWSCTGWSSNTCRFLSDFQFVEWKFDGIEPLNVRSALRPNN